MKYPYIKNIAHEEALALSGQVVTQPGQIVSKTLAQNGAVSITLFALIRTRKSAPMIRTGTPWLPSWKEPANSP